MILWYSGCGNSRFVADSLAARLGEKTVFIPQADSLSFAEGEILGIVFPVYAWSVPNLVSDFLRKVSMSGRPAYVFAACTCGDNTGYTARVLRKVLKRRGLELDAFFTFQMPNTYINLPGFKLDPPELAKSKIEGTVSKFDETVHFIGSRAKGDFYRLLGGSPFFKTYILKPLFYAFLITDRKFHAGEDCTGCGLCAKMCPLKNITMENGRPRWMGNCTNCDSCYHRCPKNAISFGKAAGKGTGQYCFKQHTFSISGNAVGQA